MKRRTVFPILLLLLLLVMLVAGCQIISSPDGSKEDTAEPQKTQQPTQQPAETPKASPEPSQAPDEEPDEQVNAFEDLTALLPEKEGYKWVYNGYAEYGHDMVLKEINRSDDQAVYKTEGEVFDMSDGASGRDYSLTVDFTVTPESIIQDKSGGMMMDTFDRIVLIQAPLEQGASWTQTVKDKEGTEMTLDCTIEEIKEENGSKVYTVTYQDKNSPFYEKRMIREGTGVILFEKLYITDAGNYEVAYSLYEEASGYDKK